MHTVKHTVYLEGTLVIFLHILEKDQSLLKLLLQRGTSQHSPRASVAL